MGLHPRQYLILEANSLVHSQRVGSQCLNRRLISRSCDETATKSSDRVQAGSEVQQHHKVIWGLKEEMKLLLAICTTITMYTT